MTIEEIKYLADQAHTPRHSVTVEEAGDQLYIAVAGIEDDTATHATTRSALSGVGDAIGIPDGLWIKGRFGHSGSHASISLPMAAVQEALAAAESID
jgi:hypothetical protein